MTPDKTVYIIEDARATKQNRVRLEAHELSDRKDYWLICGMSSMYLNEDQLEEVIDLLNHFNRSELKGNSTFTRWIYGYGIWPFLALAVVLGSIVGMIITGVLS